MESPQKPNNVRAGPFTNEDLRLRSRSHQRGRSGTQAQFSWLNLALNCRAEPPICFSEPFSLSFMGVPTRRLAQAGHNPHPGWMSRFLPLQGYQPQKFTGLTSLCICILFYQLGKMETPSLGVVVILKRVSPCKTLEPCPATMINLLPF